MKWIIITTFLLSSTLWSVAASALEFDLIVSISAGSAKSFVDLFSPVTEDDDYEWAQINAEIYEEGTEVDSEFLTCTRGSMGLDPIDCTAIAFDFSLTSSCVYCNDTTSGTGQSYIKLFDRNETTQEWDLVLLWDSIDDRECRLNRQGGGGL